MRAQIRNTWKENKKFRAAVLIECVLLLAAVISLFTGKYGMVEEYADLDAAWQEGVLRLEGISLKPGTYETRVYYRATEGSSFTFELTNENGMYKALYVNAIPLPGGKTGQSFPFWLTHSSDALRISVEQGEGLELAIDRIVINRTAAGGRIAVFGVLVLGLLIDGLWLYGGFCAAQPDRKRRKRLIWGLAGIIGVASIPLLTDYVLSGMDLIFHLIRIEGLKDGLLSGQLPVRIQPNWLYGHGYATSVFYGDTFLIIPALLRMIGFSMQTSYKLFLLALNIATAGIAYASFRRIFRDDYVGLLGSMLYTWAPYRFYDLYGRAALGETIALTFLPILCYGFYLVFTEDIGGESYRRLWILPTVGFSCIIQSHTLSCEMIGGMVVLLCLILWKKVFRRQTFAVLCKIVGATALVNAWFLMPLLEYMVKADFVVKNMGGQTIQNRGVYLIHYLFTFFRSGISSHFNERGMQQTEPLGIGFGVTACLLVYVWILFTGRYRGSRTEEAAVALGGADGRAADVKAGLAANAAADSGRADEEEVFASGLLSYGRVMAVIGGIVMIMSTNHFPWDWLQHRNHLFSVLISSLQFPMRLLTVTTLCFSFVACLVIWQIRKREKPGIWRIFVLTVIGISFLTTQYLLGDTLNSKTPLRLYNAENIGNSYVMGSEFLPVGTDPSRLAYGKYTAGENVELTAVDEAAGGSAGEKAGSWSPAFGRRNLYCRFDAVNAGTGESYVEVPLIYYPGYQAEAGGQALAAVQGDNGLVRVLLPAGFHGTVEVRFAVSLLWRTAEAVSLLGVIIMLLCEILKKRGRREKACGPESVNLEKEKI